MVHSVTCVGTVHSVCLETDQVCRAWMCEFRYLRQVVKVFHGASWSHSDPVDLVVQAVQEEAQELLSILLAAKHNVKRESRHLRRGPFCSEITFRQLVGDPNEIIGVKPAYLYPTNLGAYLWIWVLNSDGLTASLLQDVHMVWISLANSTNADTLVLLAYGVKH